MALTKTQVSELYVAIFNRASEGEGNAYWQGLGLSSAQAADAMLATTDAQEYFGDTLNDDQAFVELIYANTLNKTPEDDAEGIAYWTGLLESGLSRGEMVAALVAAVADYADSEDPATLQAFQQFNNRVAVSNYTADNLETVPADYATSLNFGADLTVTADSATVINAQTAVDALVEAQPEPPIDPGVDGETFILTDGRDNITGTDDNDTFIGDVGQNQNGAIANAFSTGDRLDGGEGRDKIVASMINDNEVDAGGTGQAPRPMTQNIEEVYIEALDLRGEGVTLDATRMENVEQYWSNFSRTDMTFDNISLQGDNLSITKDVTFGIRDTQSGTDFTAKFDSQSLIREAASQVNSSLLVRIADVSTETPSTPLANVDLNLSFDLGGETVTLEGVRSTDGTYPGLALALRNALEEAGYGDVNVNLSTPYSEVTVAGNTVTLPFTAQEILLTDPAGNAFSNVNFTQAAIESVADGFLVAGNAQPQDPSATSSLIESNLVLDNAGRGSIAGDVLIGGDSGSNLGVEQFNVLVDRDSKIASLNTTLDGSTAATSTLQNIVISSTGVAGSLYIGATQNALAEIDANAFEGAELSLGEGSDVVNLANLDAGGTTADVTFEAAYNGAGRGSDAQVFVANTGSGDDEITASLVGTSTSDSTTASLTLNAGGGDNTIVLSSTAAEVNEATVTTGSGVDTVTGGMTHLTVNTGAGNDVIYAENTGEKAQVTLFAGDWESTAGDATINTVAVPHSQLFFGREVQVTVAIPGMENASGFENGFEVTADIEASNGGFLTTERDLYEAAARAINEDPTLNKLAKASVDSNGNLTVTYLVDGEALAADELVQISVLGDFEDLSTTQRNGIRDALRAEYNNSNIGDPITDLTTAYNTVNTVDQAIVVGGPVAEAHTFEVDPAAAAPAPLNPELELTFTIDGESGSIAALPGRTLAQLDGETVEIDGETYTITEDTGVLTLTSETLAELDAPLALSVSDGTNTVAGDFTNGVTGNITGTDSLVSGGENVVNGGAGDDVIALSSDDATTDVVVFDAGQFGNDTIVHFQDGADGDVLDFSAWLNNQEQVNGSTSVESRDSVGITLNANNEITAGEVTVVDFSALSTGTGVTFDNITNAQMLEALDTAYNVAANANLVGSEQRSIVMVQNDTGDDANEGLYSVYEVTSSNEAGSDFTGATLVGTIDFGEEQAFNTANFDVSNIA